MEIPANQITSHHHLTFKTADKIRGFENFYFMSLTGIAHPKFKNSDSVSEWAKRKTATLIINVKLPLASIPKPRPAARLKVEHSTVCIGLNKFFDDGFPSKYPPGSYELVNNSGHGVEAFSLYGNDVTSGIARIKCKIVVVGKYKERSELSSLAFKLQLLLHYE